LAGMIAMEVSFVAMAEKAARKNAAAANPALLRWIRAGRCGRQQTTEQMGGGGGGGGLQLRGR
jgi:hypothetical protein